MRDVVAERLLDIAGRTDWMRYLALDTKAIRRLVRLECRKNLALLEPLHRDGHLGVSKNVAAVEIARCLEVGAFEALLGPGDAAEKALRELKKIKISKSAEDGDTPAGNGKKSSKGKSPEDTAEIRIMRLHVRIYAVKALAEIDTRLRADQLDGLASVKFVQRLTNIRKSLLAIDRALGEDPK